MIFRLPIQGTLPAKYNHFSSTFASEKRAMGTIYRCSYHFLPITKNLVKNLKPIETLSANLHKGSVLTKKAQVVQEPRNYRAYSSNGSNWFSTFGLKKKKMEIVLPEIVKAGDPILHEEADEVPIEEIETEEIQKIINDMIGVMRSGPGVGLAAPQIGFPLKIIVLEDTKEYISYASSKEIKAQDRRPFDLLVIINPKLTKKGDKTALFFEGCLSVDGFRAVVERHLEVEVMGYDRNGDAIIVEATGWQARILQHECDHLDGTIYVDKFVPKTFRTVENLDMPLPDGSPKLGVR